MSNKNIATQVINKSGLFNKLNETVKGGYECDDNNKAHDYLNDESNSYSNHKNFELWVMSDGSGISRNSDSANYYVADDVDMLDYS